jgi:hypothetical protein
MPTPFRLTDAGSLPPHAQAVNPVAASPLRPEWRVSVRVAARVVVAVVALGSLAACSRDGDDTSPVSSTSRAVVTTTSSSTASTTTPAPTTDSSLPERPPPNEPVVERSGGASALRDAASCDPANPAVSLVVLSWRPSATGEQLVAVSLLPDGFGTGRYVVSEPLAPGAARYELRRLEPGGVYYWRVLTRRGAEWIATPVQSLSGPTCIVDRPG